MKLFANGHRILIIAILGALFVSVLAAENPYDKFRNREYTNKGYLSEEDELKLAAEALSKAKKPLIIAGGGVRYSGAEEAVAKFAAERGIPVLLRPQRSGHLRRAHVAQRRRLDAARCKCGWGVCVCVCVCV